MFDVKVLFSTDTIYIVIDGIQHMNYSIVYDLRHRLLTKMSYAWFEIKHMTCKSCARYNLIQRQDSNASCVVILVFLCIFVQR